MSATVFNIGELICSGEEMKDGKFIKPIVYTKFPETAQGTNGISVKVTAIDEGTTKIEYDVDEICEAHLLVPVEYNEAEAYGYDSPSFRMILTLPDGTRLDPMEFVNLEDTYRYFNQFRNNFRYVVDSDLLRLDPAPIELIFRCHLEAKLRIADWQGEMVDISKINFTREIFTEKDVIAVIRARNVHDYVFNSYHNPRGIVPISSVNNYSIRADVTNYSNAAVTSISNIDHPDENGNSTRYYPFDPNSSIPQPAGNSIIPGNDIITMLTTDPIRKFWEWFKDEPLGIKETGPLQRTFPYTFRMGIALDADNTVNLPAQTNSIVVSVPGNKRRNLQAAVGDRALCIILAAEGSIIMSIGFATLPLGAILIAEGAAMIALSIVAGNSSNENLRKARDPIEYDKDYKKTHDYQKLLTATVFYWRVPEIGEKLRNALDRILAIEGSINISLSRYMSALKESDKKAARLQKENCETMLSLMEDELIFVSDNIDKIAEEAREQLQKTADHIIVESAEKLRKNGLPDYVKKQFAGYGFDETFISEIEAKVPDIGPEIKEKNLADLFRSLYKIAGESFIESLKQVKYIRKIDALSTNDVLRELLNHGLITYNEFRLKMDKRNYEKEYPLEELLRIHSVYKEKLNSAGIFTTQDLLKRCPRPADRKKLARLIGINDKLILKWVRMADFMRIRGVGEDYAAALEGVGADRIDKLSMSKTDALHKAIKEHVRKDRRIKKSPSKKQVSDWLKNARELDKILEY